MSSWVCSLAIHRRRYLNVQACVEDLNRDDLNITFLSKSEVLVSEVDSGIILFLDWRDSIDLRALINSDQ